MRIDWREVLIIVAMATVLAVAVILWPF